jgi:phosphate transport system permease protein
VISPAWRGGLTERRQALFRWLGRFFQYGTGALAVGFLALVIAFFAVITRASGATLVRFGPGFVVGQTWDPVHNVYGALPFIGGTLVTSAIALVLAVPVALGVAIFLSELAPVWLRDPLSNVVDLLAAVPSVVYGLWGFIIVSPVMSNQVEPALGAATGGAFPFSGTPLGLDVLTAGIILAIMILPTISAVSREVMRSVPQVHRHAALSLGATRWEATKMAVLGPARSGIVGGIMLGFGRAVGETIAVVMTIGGSDRVPSSFFSQGQSIAGKIANDLTSAFGLEVSALVELALILLVITLVINAGARLLIWKIGGGRLASENRAVATRRRWFGLRLGGPHPVPRALTPAARASSTGLPVPRPAWRIHAEVAAPAHRRRRRVKYWVVGGMAAACVVVAIAPLVSLVYTATLEGGGTLLHVTFFTSIEPPACNPATSTDCAAGGIGPAIEGTFILIGLASLIAVPVGILVAIYLTEFARNKFGLTISFFTEVMTGAPSVVLGLFVFLMFLQFDRNLLFSAVTGALALALLMLPVVIRASEEALKLVPLGVREAGLALGFPRHRVALRVVLGSAKKTIVTGVLLAVARAGGETAALLMTAFGSPFFFSGFDRPVGALGPLIYSWGLSGAPNWVADAWGAALVLLIIMLALGVVARFGLRRSTGSGEAV